jgi:hypothetical protein
LLQETEAGIFRGPEQAEFGRFGNFGDTSGTGENGKNSKTSATPKIFENSGNSANPKNFSNLGKTSLTPKKNFGSSKNPFSNENENDSIITSLLERGDLSITSDRGRG